MIVGSSVNSRLLIAQHDLLTLTAAGWGFGGGPRLQILTHNSAAELCLAILRESSLTLAMNSHACALSVVASKSFARIN